MYILIMAQFSSYRYIRACQIIALSQTCNRSTICIIYSLFSKYILMTSKIEPALFCGLGGNAGYLAPPAQTPACAAANVLVSNLSVLMACFFGLTFQISSVLTLNLNTKRIFIILKFLYLFLVRHFPSFLDLFSLKALYSF